VDTGIMPYIKQAVWQIKEKKEVSKNEGKICIDFSLDNLYLN